jgi:hypothetical protein
MFARLPVLWVLPRGCTIDVRRGLACFEPEGAERDPNSHAWREQKSITHPAGRATEQGIS